MTITVNAAVVANAGADQTSCGASSVTLAANATTGGNWTGGAGTFNPNRNTANAIILLLRVKLDRQLLLYGMFLIPMVQVLVLLQLIK
jgi:hypothetical protein